MEQINISIIDKDSFFMLGLKTAMEKYFLNIGVKVNVTKEGKANIIFRAPSKQVSINYCHVQSQQEDFYSSPLYFSMLEYKTVVPKTHCNLESGVFNRKEDVEKIVEKVITCYMNRHPFTLGRCPRCGPKLTLRESRVCRLIKHGYSQNQVAIMLGINKKTVSIHKRSAMRKLNINNNISFLQWLKKNGD